jgi:hypothetical protein
LFKQKATIRWLRMVASLDFIELKLHIRTGVRAYCDYANAPSHRRNTAPLPLKQLCQCEYDVT